MPVIFSRTRFVLKMDFSRNIARAPILDVDFWCYKLYFIYYCKYNCECKATKAHTVELFYLMQIHLHPQQTSYSSCSNVAQNSFTSIWEDKNFQIYFGTKILFNVELLTFVAIPVFTKK